MRARRPRRREPAETTPFSGFPEIAERLAAQFGKEKLYSMSAFHSVIQGLAERARLLAA